MTAAEPLGADVVVVGAGPGGMAAALEARRRGAAVLVVEVGAAIGGNGAISTGYLAFADCALQRVAGIEDSAAAFVADLEREAERQRDRYGLIDDPALTRLFAAESASAQRFLDELGVRFGRFIPRPLQHTTARMVALEDPADLRTCFERAFTEAGVRTLLRTRMERLLVEDGRVCGVRVAGPAGEGGHDVHAATVVLATGGYQANHELRRHYQPECMARTPFHSLESCQGAGQVLGQAVGGELINMTMIPPVLMIPSALVEEAIAVDARGARFHDEAGPYDSRVDALLAQPGAVGHYVLDARTAAEKRRMVDGMPGPLVKAATVEELAAVLGCDPEVLVATVAEWNATVTSGADRDPAFGRVIFPADRRGIVEPPFHSSPMVIGANFPAGGLRVTTAMEVIDVHGDVLPGLLAVGDCVGGVNVGAGLGGIHISSAVTLGRVAGRTAARRVAEAKRA